MTSKPKWQRDKRYVDSPQRLERSGDYVRVGEINPIWLRGYAEISRGHTQVELGWDARNHYLFGRRGRRAHPEMAEYEERLFSIISSPYQVHSSHYRQRKRIVLSEHFDVVKRLVVVVELCTKKQSRIRSRHTPSKTREIFGEKSGEALYCGRENKCNHQAGP